MNDCFVTVFTPTYNRAYIIEKLYESLTKQTDMDFEWLVVDDGSTDDTEELFNKIIENEKNFPVRYFKQENSGKHIAVNKGIDLAQGKMFFIVDSDDILSDNAISRIRYWENSIKYNSKFAGVSGNKGYSNQEIIGKTFDGEYIDATSLEREKLNIYGDKAEVFYTDILKEYKFPEIAGEKFITENVVWNKIANDGYKLRWFNEIIYIAEYRDDGLTVNRNKVFSENPKGYAISVLQDIKYYNSSFSDRNRRYYYYYNTIKEKVKISKAANLLKISSLKLRLIVFYYNSKIKLHDIIKGK